VDHTCFFEVELLTVRADLELHGVTLMPRPLDATEGTSRAVDSPPPPGSVVAVPCVGTNRRRMMERARPLAEHAVRILRATLRENQFTPDRQLRFRVGYVYWFEDTLAGWTTPPEEGWELELDDQLLTKARRVPVFRLPPNPRNEVERRALLALKWFEQSQLAVDPIMELLFGFSALEAILGNKSEGLKGNALALRRAVLGLRTRGHFRHPSSMFLLYDEVRSAAVHGEDAPEVTQREVDQFIWDMRLALNEFLDFAERKSVESRKAIRKALDEDPKRNEMLDTLLAQHPKHWKKFTCRERGRNRSGS
jgi:hypothetical protein